MTLRTDLTPLPQGDGEVQLDLVLGRLAAALGFSAESLAIVRETRVCVQSARGEP